MWWDTEGGCVLGAAAPRPDDYSRSLLQATRPISGCSCRETTSSTAADFSPRQCKATHRSTHPTKASTTWLGCFGSSSLLTRSRAYRLQGIPIAAALAKWERICDARGSRKIGSRMAGFQASRFLGQRDWGFASTLGKSGWIWRRLLPRWINLLFIIKIKILNFWILYILRNLIFLTLGWSWLRCISFWREFHAD